MRRCPALNSSKARDSVPAVLNFIQVLAQTLGRASTCNSLHSAASAVSLVLVWFQLAAAAQASQLPHLVQIVG